MKRILSSGRLSSAPGSQKLKHKLSLAPGLQLISSNSSGSDFFAAIDALQDEHIIHRTSRAIRSFSNATSDVLAREDSGPIAPVGHPVAAFVEKNITVDESLRENDRQADARLSASANDQVVAEIATQCDDSISQDEGSQSSSDLDVAIHPECADERGEAGTEEAAMVEQHPEDPSQGALVDRTNGKEFLRSSVLSKAESACLVDEGLIDLPSDDIRLQCIHAASYCNHVTKRVPDDSTSTRPEYYLCEVPSNERHVPDYVHISDAPDTNLGAESGSNFLPFSDTRIQNQGLPNCGRDFHHSMDGHGSWSVLEFAAALKIQAQYRGWLGRKYSQRLQASVVRMQQTVRKCQGDKRRQKVLNAVIVLQKNWRMFQSVRFVNRLKIEQEIRRKENSAVVVQKHWRGRHDRLLAKHLKRERALIEQRRITNAAILLQSRWRHLQFRRLEKQEKVRLKNRNSAAIMIQKHWRALQIRRFVSGLKAQQERQALWRRICAVIVIQKYWRGLQSRRAATILKTKIETECLTRSSNAVVLQKHWRALQSRRLADSMRLELAKEMQRSRATIILQKHWRAVQSRRLTESMKLVIAQREHERYCGAVVLQKHWRALQSRRLVKSMRLESAEEMQRSGAAVILQKHWRAVQSRRWTESRKLAIAQREHERNCGAVVLQKHWRMLQSRRLVQSMRLELAEGMQKRGAAVILQKHWRALQGRRSTECMKKLIMAQREHMRNCGAVVLQKYWRALQGRLLAHSAKLELDERMQRSHAAIIVQKHYRAVQSRHLLESMKLAMVQREQARNSGALVLQKHWRALQSRCLANFMKLELEERMQRTSAAVVLQKLWRARESKRLRLALAERHDGAIVLQKHWRGLQSRRIANDLNIELAERLQRRTTAAVTVQKHWRALQAKRLTASLKLAIAEREHIKNCSAVVLQKHWRGTQSRRLAHSLKLKSADRMQRSSAALVLQKHWRALQSRQVQCNLKLALAERELARHRGAVVLQKHWRAKQSRSLVVFMKIESAERTQRKFAAAVVLQRQWRAYRSQILTNSIKLAMAEGFQTRSSAAVTVQRYWRTRQTCTELNKFASKQQRRNCGTTVVSEESEGNRKLLHQAAVILQRQWRRRHRKPFMDDNAAVEEQTDTQIAIGNGCSVSFGSGMKPTLPEVQDLVMGRDKTANSEAILQSDSQDRVMHQALGSELCTRYAAGASGVASSSCSYSNNSGTLDGDSHIEGRTVHEDWNFVSVDSLEECLDTCLSTLRPLPSEPSLALDHCIPSLQSLDSPLDTWQGILARNTTTANVVTRDSETVGCNSESECAQNGLSLTADASNQYGEINHQVNPKQDQDCQNEERLKQFAQVFLLQRQISIQQQRAQAAPPFPVNTESGSGVSSSSCSSEGNLSSSKEKDDVQQVNGCVAGNGDNSVLRDMRTSNANPIPSMPATEQSAFETSLEKVPVQHQASIVAATHPVETSPPDVVLDMVLLLQDLGERGFSESDLEGDSHMELLSTCGDIEEGLPLLGRALGSLKEQGAAHGVGTVSTFRRVSLPDVNAMLLVIIAMVVYTKAICRGVFFRTRHTPRQI